MAVTDFASVGAATGAGYVEVVLDRGASWTASSRYEVVLEKQLVGGAGTGVMFRGFGVGSSQALAEAQALATLNGRPACEVCGSNDSFGVPLAVDIN